MGKILNTPWMQTYQGRQSWPLNVESNGLAVRDAAHALGMQCRYAGHCIKFYSVAEHSVLLYRYARDKLRAPRSVCKAVLFHDKSEYLLVDIPRAVKPELKGYYEIEAVLCRKIADKWRVEYPWPKQVMELDNRILLDERAQNMTPFRTPDEYYLLDDPSWKASPVGYGWRREEESGWPFSMCPLFIYLQFWTPEQAEAAFLDAFEECKDY